MGETPMPRKEATRLKALDRRRLSDLTWDAVDASRVAAGQSLAKSPPNGTGHTLIRPGGRECYPAFWVRGPAHGAPFECFSKNGVLPQNPVYMTSVTVPLSVI